MSGRGTAVLPRHVPTGADVIRGPTRGTTSVSGRYIADRAGGMLAWSGGSSQRRCRFPDHSRLPPPGASRTISLSSSQVPSTGAVVHHLAIPGNGDIRQPRSGLRYRAGAGHQVSATSTWRQELNFDVVRPGAVKRRSLVHSGIGALTSSWQSAGQAGGTSVANAVPHALVSDHGCRYDFVATWKALRAKQSIAILMDAFLVEHGAQSPRQNRARSK